MVLEVTGYPDPGDMRVCAGRKEDPELQRTLRLVAFELPAPAALIHEDHRPPRRRRKKSEVIDETHPLVGDQITSLLPVIGIRIGMTFVGDEITFQAVVAGQLSVVEKSGAPHEEGLPGTAS
jgi:hypothetical protein